MITSENIKKLRIKTGAGMMDCKKALEEVNGDLNAAADWLRKKGISTAQKKSSRDASEGLITISLNSNIASIIEINCETDFVARNEDFQNFCLRLSDLILEKKITNLEELSEVNYKEGTKVKDGLTAMIAKVGENLVIKRLKFINEKNLKAQKYIHNSVNENSGKIGVVLSYLCDKDFNEEKIFSKNLCMHIAAMEPKSINSDDLNQNLIEKEKNIYFEQIKDSGKPKEILKKIIDGKINKFYEEVCLLDQFFVIDNKVKIKDSIKNFEKENNCNFEIKSFTFFKVGEVI